MRSAARAPADRPRPPLHRRDRAPGARGGRHGGARARARRRACRRRLPIDGPVIVLQPRRVAARSLARRIADEQGWTHRARSRLARPLRAPVRAGDAVLFATEGILTARLQQDPLLTGFTHHRARRVPRAQHSRGSRASRWRSRRGWRAPTCASWSCRRRSTPDAWRRIWAAVRSSTCPARSIRSTFAMQPDARRRRRGRRSACVKRAGTGACVSCRAPARSIARARRTARAAGGSPRVEIVAAPRIARRAGAGSRVRARRRAGASSWRRTSPRRRSRSRRHGRRRHRAAQSRALRSGAGGRQPRDGADLAGLRRSAGGPRRPARAGRRDPAVEPAAIGCGRTASRTSSASICRAPCSTILAWGGDPRSFDWFEPPPADRADAALDAARAPGRRRCAPDG